MKSEMLLHRPGYWLGLALLLLITTGCSAQHAFNAGTKAFQKGNFDQSVADFYKAVQKDPERDEYRMQLYSARIKAGLAHLKAARDHREAGEMEEAIGEYQMALAFDGSLQVALTELSDLQREMGIEEQLTLARRQLALEQYAQARKTALALLSLRPELAEAQKIADAADRKLFSAYGDMLLDIQSSEPVSIEFKNTDVREAFGILARMTGLQFIFDNDLKPQRMTLQLQKVTPGQAMEAMLKIHGLKAKQLNRRTFLVYPATPQKEKLYEDQVIRTFYLSHIKAKDAVTLVRSVLKSHNLAINEKSNSLVIRDNPSVVKLAEKMLEAADREEPEVMYELELIEVNHTDSLLFGPSLNPYSISGGIAKAGTVVSNSLGPGSSVANLLTSFNGTQGVFSLPTASFDFQKTLVDSEILASPKIRVKNYEKAKVHVGTREPVITVNTSGDIISESVQYVDVGVKLDIEPEIQLDGTIVTKVNLEVSNVIDRTQTENGTLVLSISTTNAESALVLKDGERTVIGGLIRDDNTQTRKVIPILGDLPLLGKLFNNHKRDRAKREILLSIVPHIVRSMDIPGQNLTHLISGGESDPRDGGNFAAFGQDPGVFDEVERTNSDPVQEVIEEVPEDTGGETAQVEEPPQRGGAAGERSLKSGSGDE
jgi:general secretion pathway protein D